MLDLVSHYITVSGCRFAHSDTQAIPAHLNLQNFELKLKRPQNTAK